MSDPELEKAISRLFADLPRRSLSVPGKEQIWQRVHNHIVKTRLDKQPEPAGSVWRHLLLPRTLARVGATVMVVILALTMVSRVAKAQPGETLYTVKIAAEQVEKVLATGDEAKVNVGIKHAKRRLQEVKTLIEENKDSKIVQQTLQALKTTTDEVVAASEITPELATKATELAVEQQKVLVGVENTADSSVKEAVQDAIGITRDTINKLSGDSTGDTVKGVATAPPPVSLDKSGDAPTTTVKIALPKQPVSKKPVKKDQADANAAIGADVQIDVVITIDENNKPEPVE